MVSWSGDGLISGYDPVTKRLVPNLYHLASPGTVDLNGVTRLGYDIDSAFSTATYPNRIDVSAPITLSATDMSNNAGKYVGVALYWVDASYFPAGFIPKPSDIVALGDSKVNVEVGDTMYGPGGGGASHTFTMHTTNKGFGAGTKFWCCVLPVTATNLSAPQTISNFPPAAGVAIDTVARCVSLWTTRSPGKPTITSPVNGAIYTANTTFTLTLNPNDPDEVAPEDAQKFNDDVNGVHFQYAPVPTADNPNPAWTDMPYDMTFPGVGTYREYMWYIRGSRYYNGLNPGMPELESLVANLGCSVVAGASDRQADYQPGKGALPTGTWMIRGRTFSYGHPYPNLGTSTTEPGPLGINPATTQLIEPAKDSYPSVMTSPWSDPVKVVIPAQVPPPLPISPKDHRAVSENTTVRLNWQYRNTYTPPRSQYRRCVQIRKVGDPNWATIFDGFTAQTYVDLPPALVQTPIPDVTVFTDDFETGLGGWASTGSNVSTLSRVNSPANAHAGSYYLQVVSPTTGEANILKVSPSVPAQYENVDLSFWAYKDAALGLGGLVQMWWKDAGGVDIIPPDPMNSPFAVVVRFGDSDAGGIKGAVGWNKYSIPTPIHRPPNGVSLNVQISLDPYPFVSAANTFRVDDITMVAHGPAVNDFTISATNEYEWRVQTTDTDGIVSNYSEPARFWIVPGADTGPGRVVPSETIEGATLGCGTHRVQVFRRGGKKYVGEIKNLSHLDYSRVRDDISTAQIVVSGWDIDCGNLLAKLQCWAYEIVIWRNNGYSEDRVWEGPITLLTYENDKVTIDAKDVMAYAYRRIIKQKMSDAGTGNGTTVVDRARRVLQNVFAPDDPNVLSYLRVLARADDSMQYRSTPAYSRTAFEEVDDMAANAGLDYTVVGRSIMLWGTKHRIGTLPEFTDEDLGNSPIVSEYGMSMANRYAVSDGNGVYGEATRGLDVSGNDETYGLVEMLSSTWASSSESDSGTYTQAGLATVIASFTEFAERSIADRYPPPVVVRIPDNTSLNPGAVVSIQHLVPGVVIPLRSTKTLRTVVASQKLDSVKVVEENGKETVSITVSPFSRDDATAVEGA